MGELITTLGLSNTGTDSSFQVGLDTPWSSNIVSLMKMVHFDYVNSALGNFTHYSEDQNLRIGIVLLNAHSKGRFQ